MNDLINFAFNVFWQTALISVVGFILLKVFAKWSAPKRSLLASSFLIALVLLPLLTYLFMSVNINPPKYSSFSVPVFNYIENKGEKLTEGTLPVKNLVVNKLAQTKIIEPPIESDPLISPQIISNAMTIVAYIWCVGISFMLGRLFYGLIFLRGFRFGLTLVKDEKIRGAMKTALTVFNSGRLPEVYISSKVESPITIGLFKPIMILPEKLYSSLKENEIKSITLHEFSHIYHYDHLMGVMKRIALATNWWNPLVYIISAEHSITREEVSDNYVLSQLKPKVYSECLVELATRTCLISSLPATVGMADKHISLEQRIINILSKKRKREMTTQKTMKGSIFGLTCLAVIFVGGMQYTFADNLLSKKEISLGEFLKNYSKGKKISPEEAEKLEIKVSKNLDDSKAVIELFGYYGPKLKNNSIRIKKNKIIFKLIENYPESEVFLVPRIPTIPSFILGENKEEVLKAILKNPDSKLAKEFRYHLDNYKTLVKLWKTQVAKQPENLKILWNASNNLFVANRKLAEKYLKKGQSLEPENPQWARGLGQLYLAQDQTRKLQGKQVKPQNALRAYKEFKLAYNETKMKNSVRMLPQMGKAATGKKNGQ